MLSLAAEKSGWGAKLPAGRGRGIALANAFGSYIALVAEVSIEPKKGVRVRRVVAVVDCGRAVNPDMVRAQIEGGVIFGAGAALMSEITVANGRVEQASYSDYPILTMNNTTATKVIVTVAPTGGMASKQQNPNLPTQPDEIAQSVIRKEQLLQRYTLAGPMMRQPAIRISIVTSTRRSGRNVI